MQSKATKKKNYKSIRQMEMRKYMHKKQKKAREQCNANQMQTTTNKKRA